MIDNATLFVKMLACMIGEDELEAMQDEHYDRLMFSAPHNPDDWGLDDDDLAEARTDYATLRWGR